ncbi:MAG: Trp family transcriptional regulator [Candidatus Doudnabacteria bacterium]|nr:Trp family transcriptional regulator [Candidatus Doudnabacteria bacterium]
MSQAYFDEGTKIQTKKCVANLFKVLTKLPPRAAMSLYGDLLTESEAVMLAKRLEIAVSLLSGQTYRNIQLRLNVTPGTVAQIARVLKISGEGFKTAQQLFL